MIPEIPVVIVKVKVPTVFDAALLAKTVTSKTPGTSGTPEIWPLVALRLKPFGNSSEPKVIGPEPVAVSLKLNGAPCFPVTFVPLVNTGRAKTVKAALTVVVEPTEFVTTMGSPTPKLL